MNKSVLFIKWSSKCENTKFIINILFKSQDFKILMCNVNLQKEYTDCGVFQTFDFRALCQFTFSFVPKGETLGKPAVVLLMPLWHHVSKVLTSKSHIF